MTGVQTCALPILALFAVEQLVNGWNNGFEGPEDTADFAVEAVE